MSMIRYSNFFDSLFNNELRIFDMSDDIFDNNIKFKEHNNKLIYEFNVAGIPKEALKLTLKNTVLSLNGSIEEKSNNESGEYVFNRSVHQSVKLPSYVDISSITTDMKDGILKIIINKKQEDKREIKIN